MIVQRDGQLAARLAEVVGRMLLEIRASGVFPPEALGGAGDRIANQFLIDALHAVRPDDGLLSEEMKCDGARLSHSRVWIIDPVDGTREFGEGRADWAVHVGLAIDGVPAAGAVALPAMGLVLRSDSPVALPPLSGPLRIVVSRTRPPRVALQVAEKLGAVIVEMGSAGAKAMAVVRGDADVYLHTGGQFEWDSMAPVAVALAHGLHCTRIDGSALRYNGADPYLPDLLIARPEYAQQVLALIELQ